MSKEQKQTMTQTNSTEKKEARREWFLRFDDYKYKFHIAYDERKYHDDIHVVEAKWRDCAMRLADALDNVVPRLEKLAKLLKEQDKNTPPNQGIHEHDALLIACGFMKAGYENVLEEFSKLSGGEG